ncbi:imidazole glycerol phosphate synthase subunit hisH [Cyanobacterium stanieri PCC 7202]|uniref:Imidazole glycerol phosphate synthase subunit HisH n=1 Tax=Cyanobacterium stanieri (strain ATCC 29140 / PCC 7202) TaxID=292563 RepID=K9YKT7_CYASC|nr:imidazole glycerol phosphate synthase subunit hisH [Cyanobacterium stanieri PCC 7202]
MKIAVIDYDMGNLHSVCKGLEKAGAIPEITDSAEVIAQAKAIVLPGVGAFDPAMEHLKERNLIEPLKGAIASGTPFLGICLGLQILFESSEEGKEKGLGVVRGKVRRFQSEPNLTIPHMGWNTMTKTQPEHPLWAGLPPETYLYFVHSFYVDPTDKKVIAGEVTHGSQKVTSAIAHKNLMAVQFHPEKSSDYGLKILSNFVKLIENKKN